MPCLKSGSLILKTGIPKNSYAGWAIEKFRLNQSTDRMRNRLVNPNFAIFHRTKSKPTQSYAYVIAKSDPKGLIFHIPNTFKNCNCANL